MQRAHNSIATGHLGREETYSIIARDYY
ncbi:hypothetical protein G3565_28640 [Escherichia coli]|nr:hypothetical protein [Escherichia coli]